MQITLMLYWVSIAKCDNDEGGLFFSHGSTLEQKKRKEKRWKVEIDTVQFLAAG